MFKERQQHLSSIAIWSTNTSTPFTCLVVCLVYSYLWQIIGLVVSPPLPQQGQEYAALGALVNDDEPLSSPPGSTEMELKVKQVCPSTVTSVTCWEQVENDSCDLVRSGTKVPILSRLNSTSRNLATTLTAIVGSILGRDCTENVIFETYGFLKLANIFSITRKSCKHKDLLVNSLTL